MYASAQRKIVVVDMETHIPIAGVSVKTDSAHAVMTDINGIANIAERFDSISFNHMKYLSDKVTFEEMKDTVIGILKHLDTGEDSDVVEQTRTLATYKNEIRECIDLMLLWFKDLLVVKATGDMNRIVYQENYPALQQQAAHRTYNAIEEAVQAMEEAKAQLRANVNFDNVIELMLMQMRKE